MAPRETLSRICFQRIDKKDDFKYIRAVYDVTPIGAKRNY